MLVLDTSFRVVSDIHRSPFCGDTDNSGRSSVHSTMTSWNASSSWPCRGIRRLERTGTVENITRRHILAASWYWALCLLNRADRHTYTTLVLKLHHLFAYILRILLPYILYCLLTSFCNERDHMLHYIKQLIFKCLDVRVSLR